MDNRLLDATWAYHNGTKHSDQSVRMSAHLTHSIGGALNSSPAEVSRAWSSCRSDVARCSAAQRGPSSPTSTQHHV